MAIQIPTWVGRAASTTRQALQHNTYAQLAAVTAIALPVGIALGTLHRKRRERRAFTAGMPAGVPRPQSDQEVLSRNFNVHKLNGDRESEDVLMLAQMYEDTYGRNPAFDANAALGLELGHPPGTRGYKATKR